MSGLQVGCSPIVLDRPLEIHKGGSTTFPGSMEDLSQQSTSHSHLTLLAQTVQIADRLQMSICQPMSIQSFPDLLTQENGRIRLPSPDTLHLMAWYLDGHQT